MEKSNHGTTRDCRPGAAGGSEDIVTIQDFFDSVSIKQVACWSTDGRWGGFAQRPKLLSLYLTYSSALSLFKFSIGFE